MVADGTTTAVSDFPRSPGLALHGSVSSASGPPRGRPEGQVLLPSRLVG